MRPVLLGFVGGPVLMIVVAYLWTHQTVLAWIAGLLAAVFIVVFIGGMLSTRERRPTRAQEAEQWQREAIAALDVDTAVQAGPVRGAPTEIAT